MIVEKLTMDNLRSRPRFKILRNRPKEICMKRFRDYISQHKNDFSASVNNEMIIISVNTNEHHFWKPFLEIRMEEEDQNTIIRGVFGPSASVWTFFMFLYFGFSIFFMIFITIWFVEKQIGSSEFPWALGASFLSLILLGLTYTASLTGRYKAKNEMKKLHRFVVQSTFNKLRIKN